MKKDHAKGTDIMVSWGNMLLDHRNLKLAPITTHRYLGGSGEERGSIKVEFNNYNDFPTNITYLESIPWILKIYLHTFSVTSNLKGLNDSLVQKLLFTPAIDRKRPTVMEVLLTLPPTSRTYLSFDYECAFVKLTEHHPDANHGFDIGYA